MVKSGVRIGPYELLSPIGAGGMGEVWKARDTRLERTVAVKFSQAAFTGRFQQEARAIAALNHPNIATLHDVGPDYLVMEFVDGEPIKPPNDTRKLLDIAVQIADGLAAAHAAGIIHRDLKPGNILLTKNGRVKILDFGLAKQTIGADDATQTIGAIAGTAAYMSPEQARGQTLDTRSDQFSFGLVLYELAAGKRAFQRASTAETLAAIIRDEPESLPETVPLPLRWTIERCLAKDPENRYDTTRGLFLELRTIRDRPTGATAAAGPVRKTIPRPAVWVLGAIVAAGGAWIAASNRTTPPPELKYTPFAADACNEAQPAWSPDGRTLAYVCEVDGVSQVFTRALDAAVPSQITQGKTAAIRPFWSPDASRIYFEQDENTYFTGATGGPPQLFLNNAIYASLSPDGKRVAFTRRRNQSGAVWFASGDGTGERQYRGKGFPETVRSAVPRFSPDGKRLAIFTLAVELEEGARELWILPGEGGDPVKTPAFLRQYSLGMGPFSWLGNDKLLFSNRSPEAKEAEPHLYTIDVISGVQRALTAGPLFETEPAVSPDGRRIAVTIRQENSDIYEFQLDTGKGKQVTDGPRWETGAVWAPSGGEFAYIGELNGKSRLWLRAENGPPRPLLLSGPPIENLNRIAYSPDGRRLALDSSGDPHRAFLVSAAGGVPIAIDPASMDSHGAAFSPDGAWIAYTRYKDKTGMLTKVATGGGGQPVDLIGTNQAPGFHHEWSPAGDWIAYSAGQQLRLISPDGKRNRTLSKDGFRAWTFLRDGSHIYGLKRGKDRRWEVGAINVATGAERFIVTLDIPPRTDARPISLHPDGKRFLTSLSTGSSDIWIIEGVR